MTTVRCNICDKLLSYIHALSNYEFDLNLFIYKFKFTCYFCRKILLSFQKDQVIKLCEPKIIYDLWLIKKTNLHKNLNLDVFYYIFKLMLQI